MIISNPHLGDEQYENDTRCDMCGQLASVCRPEGCGFQVCKSCVLRMDVEFQRYEWPRVTKPPYTHLETQTFPVPKEKEKKDGI